MKRGRTAVKGNGTVGLTEGRKEGRKSERKDYQLSVQSPAGFVIGGQSKKNKKKNKRKKRWPCVCCQSVHITASSQLHSHQQVLQGVFPPYNKVSYTETGEMLP